MTPEQLRLRQDTGSKFFRAALDEQGEQQALQVSPFFLAYLQNKIEVYASAVVDAKLPYNSDPTKQVEAILEHERLRNFVAAYEELLAELVSAQPEPNSGE